MSFFEFDNTKTTRKLEQKLFKPRCTSNIRLNFFSQRVINVGNSLPSTVNFSSLSAFKRSLENVDFSASVRSSYFVLFSVTVFHFSFYGQLSLSCQCPRAFLSSPAHVLCY